MKRLIFTGFIFLSLLNTKCAYSDDTKGKITAFWKFVSEKESELVKLDGTPSPLYDELFSQIELVDENIYILLYNETIDNKKNLVITSGGKSEYFALCDKIVSMAPPFKILQPVSLCPAYDTIEPFSYGDIKVGVEDVRVHFDNSETDISLLFVLDEYHLENIRQDDTGRLYSVYMQILYIMTQQILGERLAGKKVKSGDISPLSTIVPTIPIMELKKYIK